MIGIGDKVVCIEDENNDTDWMYAIQVGLKNFTMPIVGDVYTVRDICTGVVKSPNTEARHRTGILLFEISAGIDKDGYEWWYDIESFRKVVDTSLLAELCEALD
jgi:hypothetical protein